MPAWLRIAGWAVTVGAIAVYLVMVTVTLPHLMALAGQPVFDLMPGGYDIDTARSILTALGEEGRSYYVGVQHLLDAAFPPLLGLTLAYWLWRTGRRWRDQGLPMRPIVMGLLIGFAFLATAFDLAENAMVGQMLDLGAEGLTEPLVNAASTFTLGKATVSSIAYTALLVLALGPWVAGLLNKRQG